MCVSLRNVFQQANTGRHQGDNKAPHWQVHIVNLSSKMTLEECEDFKKQAMM